MQVETASSHGLMEGNGAYNKHSVIQATGIISALPVLKKALRNVEVGRGDDPMVIADYGSSQGKNSLRPLRLAIENLRSRTDANRPVFVFHIDQPSNDFNSLFEVLGSDADTYLRGEPNVFPCVIGRSFYEQVLPADSVHLGWSSYAAVWLSHVPALITGHIRASRGTETERAAFRRQAAEDWENFLSLRAKELREGGRLIVVLPATNDDGVPEPALEHAMDLANELLGEMVADGVITTAERAQMVIGTFARRRCDLLAPFRIDSQFHGLTV